MINISKIKQKLVGFGVQGIAKETKFHMRDSGKIDCESGGVPNQMMLYLVPK